MLQQAGSQVLAEKEGRGQVAGNHPACKHVGPWAEKGKQEPSEPMGNHTFWVIRVQEVFPGGLDGKESHLQ